jgi:ABC-type Na+ efflux pump permease subunit
MGGAAGFVHSTVPVVVFITANAFLPLPLAIGTALASGLALFGFRLLRGERFATAVGSLLGVAVAAALVALTGSARDFFAIGIWLSLAGFVVTLGSVLARRPLTGVVWSLVHGGTHDWRADGPVRRAHDLATLAAALVLGARFAVQHWLYSADSTTGLGIARVAMGTPLTILAALVVVWAFRRSTRRLVRTAGGCADR